MKTIMIIALVLFCGCATIEGYGVKYTRWGVQQLDDVIIGIKDPNGLTISVLIEGQKSDTELALQAAGFGAKMGGGK